MTADEPAPVGPVPLPALHLLAQDITCCTRPMRVASTQTSWTGQHGSGTEHLTSNRICPACGATLTITTNTPS